MIEHPLIGNLDQLTSDQLTEKITDLNKKLSIAMQMGNGYLCNQLRMALTTYNNKYQQKIKDSYANTESFANRIDIS